jgi:hypothetical protein
MLAELAKKERGRFVRRSAEDLKKAIGADSLQTITGCAKTIRTNIQARLRKELGLLVADQDVLVRDGQGYHLQDWIEVEEAASGEDDLAGAAVAADPAGEVVAGAAAAPASKTKGVAPSSPVDAATRARREWIMAEIRRGSAVSRDAVAARFRISPTTAKRDFAALTARGLIEFVRRPHPGRYHRRQDRRRLDITQNASESWVAVPFWGPNFGGFDEVYQRPFRTVEAGCQAR